VVARGIREVLVGRDPAGVELSQRATDKLAELRAAHGWAASDTTTVVADERGRVRWWTFAGWKANLALARVVDDLRTEVGAIDDLTVALDASATAPDVARRLDAAVPDPVDLTPWVTTEALEGLKFAECLPVELARAVVARRLADPASVAVALAERVAGFRSAAS
jgi:ATP-dependent Lhr-like helicase